jgi:hypothetical protein
MIDRSTDRLFAVEVWSYTHSEAVIRCAITQ